MSAEISRPRSRRWRHHGGSRSCPARCGESGCCSPRGREGWPIVVCWVGVGAGETAAGWRWWELDAVIRIEGVVISAALADRERAASMLTDGWRCSCRWQPGRRWGKASIRRAVQAGEWVATRCNRESLVEVTGGFNRSRQRQRRNDGGGRVAAERVTHFIVQGARRQERVGGQPRHGGHDETDFVESDQTDGSLVTSRYFLSDSLPPINIRQPPRPQRMLQSMLCHSTEGGRLRLWKEEQVIDFVVHNMRWTMMTKRSTPCSKLLLSVPGRRNQSTFRRANCWSAAAGTTSDQEKAEN